MFAKRGGRSDFDRVFAHFFGIGGTSGINLIQHREQNFRISDIFVADDFSVAFVNKALGIQALFAAGRRSRQRHQNHRLIQARQFKNRVGSGARNDNIGKRHQVFQLRIDIFVLDIAPALQFRIKAVFAGDVYQLVFSEDLRQIPGDGFVQAAGAEAAADDHNRRSGRVQPGKCGAFFAAAVKQAVGQYGADAGYFSFSGNGLHRFGKGRKERADEREAQLVGQSGRYVRLMHKNAFAVHEAADHNRKRHKAAFGKDDVGIYFAHQPACLQAAERYFCHIEKILPGKIAPQFAG